jgi:hypothetical protein
LLLGYREHLPEVLIIGEFTFVAGLARLFVHLGLGFLNEHGGNGQRELIGLVEQGEEVDAFNVAFETVVLVGSNQGAFISMGFFGQRVVDDQHGKLPPGSLAWVCRTKGLAFRHRSLESK